MTVKAITNIFRSKTRSLLTMAGIAVGVFSVVLISTVGTVGTSQVSATLITMGVDTLLVQAADNSVSVTLTDRDTETVRVIKRVVDIRYNCTVTVRVIDLYRQLVIGGTSAELLHGGNEGGFT